MLPWEHLAVGYLGYSVCVRLFARRAPGGAAALALALGTQFPDLVDKPLAWSVGVLPSGYSLAHSLFVAVPLSVLVATSAWGLGRSRVGVAFAFGYLSHLPADVFYPLLVGGAPVYSTVLWPLVPASDPAATAGFLETVRRLFGRYVTELATDEARAYLAAELGLLASAFLLWLLDGTPPLGGLWSRDGPEEAVEEAP